MHYFVMVSYTSMVPFQIHLSFFVENLMEIHRLPHLQASGQARPQSRNIKKIQRNSMGPRLASRSKTSPAIGNLRENQ